MFQSVCGGCRQMKNVPQGDGDHGSGSGGDQGEERLNVAWCTFLRVSRSNSWGLYVFLAFHMDLVLAYILARDLYPRVLGFVVACAGVLCRSGDTLVYDD